MRFRYTRHDPRERDEDERFAELRRLLNYFLLMTNGDVDQALRMMEELSQQYGIYDDALGPGEFKRRLLEEGVIAEGDEGNARLTRKGESRMRRDSLERIFGAVHGGGGGQHRTPKEGGGGERLTETRPFRFGDDVHALAANPTLENVLRRGGIDDLSFSEDDLEVYDEEKVTFAATVLLIDVSHSMILYGQDRITPAKDVAMALAELILTKYPKDRLNVVVFGDDAQEVAIKDLPYVSVGPYHTNTRAALQRAQKILLRHKTPNRQIFMITDGKPSAITEGGRLYKNPFGLDLKVVNKTLDEAVVCRRRGIVISTFMLADDPHLMNFVERLTRVNRGRAYYAGVEDLGQFLFVDYIQNRKRKYG